MFFRQYHGEWYGLWCDECGTLECVCGNARSADESAWRPSYTEALNTWYINDTRSLDQLARDFYSAVTRRLIYGENTTDEINTIAEVIAKGAAISCLGEARYEVLCTMHEVAIRAKSEYITNGLYKHSPLGRFITLQGWWGMALDYAPVSRDNFGDTIAHHFSPAQAARFARHVFAMHLRFTGKSEGVGGVLWWEGARLTDDYYRGKISPMVYADLMFNAMHNGGNLLNKAFSIDHDRLTGVLDMKRWAEPEQLLEFLSDETALYERVKSQLVDPHTISKKDLLALEQANLIDYFGLGKKKELYAVGFPAWYTSVYGLDDRKATTWTREYTAPKKWNIARVPRSVLYDTMTRRFKGETEEQYTLRMSKPVNGATVASNLVQLLAADAGMSAAYFVPKFPPPWAQNPDEADTRSVKADKYEAFFDKYTARPTAMSHYSCQLCVNYKRNHSYFDPELYVKKFRTYGDDYEDEGDEDDEHYCSADTPGCFHDGCCCCCKAHTDWGHDEWCVNDHNCDQDIEGCRCLDDYCCHLAYLTDDGEHYEYCSYYVKEEDDAEG